MHGVGGSHIIQRIRVFDGSDRQKVYEGGTKMTNKVEVAQVLLERISELTKVCNDAETALVIKDLSEARHILLNS
ncbi:hypothetical protein [Bacillus mycoides]|uniref:hypothetical protein n=1 Tax=Bacillus mycoides TaxID=1405 RepID=UPI0015612982|nr:hypothetical protein [Bacillus mycoides]